jgi:hypothetical protein
MSHDNVKGFVQRFGNTIKDVGAKGESHLGKKLGDLWLITIGPTNLHVWF